MKRTRKGQAAFEKRNETPTVTRTEYAALRRLASGYPLNRRFVNRLLGKGLLLGRGKYLSPSAYRVLETQCPPPAIKPIVPTMPDKAEYHRELLARVRDQFGSPFERYHRSPIKGNRAGVWG